MSTSTQDGIRMIKTNKTYRVWFQNEDHPSKMSGQALKDLLGKPENRLCRPVDYEEVLGKNGY